MYPAVCHKRVGNSKMKKFHAALYLVLESKLTAGQEGKEKQLKTDFTSPLLFTNVMRDSIIYDLLLAALVRQKPQCYC